MKKLNSGTNLSLLLIVGLCLILMYYSVRLGVSSLYKIGLENQIDSYTDFMFSADKSSAKFTTEAQQYRETIDQLGQNLYSLNPYNPDVLSLLAYVATSHYWDGQDAVLSLENSSQLHRQESSIRPVGYNAYAEEAFTRNYQGKAFSEVLEQLKLAQHFGPFEFATARAGIELLFPHWSELNKAQKLQAMDYILSHKHYGLTIGKLNELVSHSINKTQLCNVAKFARLFIAHMSLIER